MPTTTCVDTVWVDPSFSFVTLIASEATSVNVTARGLLWRRKCEPAEGYPPYDLDAVGVRRLPSDAVVGCLKHHLGDFVRLVILKKTVLLPAPGQAETTDTGRTLNTALLEG